MKVGTKRRQEAAGLTGERVQDWMSPTVVASPEETVRAALELMLEHRTGHVLVMEGPRLVGIVSNRDVIRTTARNPERRLDLGCALRDIMTPQPLLSTHPEESVLEAARQMHAARINALPVMRAGRVEGLLSSGDVLRAATRGSG